MVERDTDILSKIVKWAQDEAEIRVIILEGSRASNVAADRFADYDLNIFISDHTKYIADNNWMAKFDDIIVYQKEGFPYEDEQIPTRLVVYKNSPKVDFSFWPINILYEIANNTTLPERYRNGYKVLLDKDNITKNMPPSRSDGFIVGKPIRDDVLKTIYDFWFEAYCIVKYLKRNSLWYAKMVENGPIKRFLLKMILWNVSSKDKWKNKRIHLEGKNLEARVDEETKRGLVDCFSTYDKKDTWQSLCAMMKLFKKVSHEVTARLSITYPEKSISQIEAFIEKLYKG